MLSLHIDIAHLKREIAHLRRFHNELYHREKLHNKMRNYQRRRWKENLYNEGATYGPWDGLSNFTNKIRIARGILPGHPILYQIGGGGGRRIKNMPGYLRRAQNPRAHGGGLLHAWVESNILADQFLEYGANASTIWKFQASAGASADGSYAVYHDVGFTTGAASMFPGFSVPARHVFSGGDGSAADEADADEYKAETERYIERIIAHMR